MDGRLVADVSAQPQLTRSDATMTKQRRGINELRLPVLRPAETSL